MRYTINKINKGEDELILNYKEKNPEVEAVLLFMDKRQRKLIGRKNDETIVFTPEEILYIEKVDNKTLNKIAARWPVKAVAQFFHSKKQWNYFP